jgi:DNA-directed RNA polymerase subunit RPC12/RpoP
MRGNGFIKVVAILICLTIAGSAWGQIRTPGMPSIPQPPRFPQPTFPQPSFPQPNVPHIPQPYIPPPTHMVLVKRCMNCGHEVPANSRNGDRCPYCGVVWGSPSDLAEERSSTSTAAGDTTVELYCGHCKKAVPDSSDFGQCCPHCGVKWVDGTHDTLLAKTTVTTHDGSSTRTISTTAPLTPETRNKLHPAALRIPGVQTIALWLGFLGGGAVLVGLGIGVFAWQKNRATLATREAPRLAPIDYEPPPSAPPATGPGKTQWMYYVGGQQLGPVTSAQLKQLAATGRLAPSDRVWREGMTKWVPASMVKGLFSAAT